MVAQLVLQASTPCLPVGRGLCQHVVSQLAQGLGQARQWR